ncbi:MAG: citrate synthase [Thermaerobacter sp.]|nr:citrate synthase [Thermaerobacter sp.]
MAETGFKAGLEDVVAGTSDICFIDGKEGRLVYAGYDIHDLANHGSFEETVYLLWHDRLPTRQELDNLEATLRRQAELPEPVLRLIEAMPKGAEPMEVLRTAVSAMSVYDPDDHDNSYEASVRKAERLVARFPTLVAAIGRVMQGQTPIAPDPGLNVAHNFLHMLFGKGVDDRLADIFDTCLVLHADHELNASTFSARVTAGTLSDIYSAITSAVGTLKGPLHGGANEQVMRMLLEIGTVDEAQTWITDALQQKKKIMGFGHRVYRTEDPRATHLRRFSEEVGKKMGDGHWYEMSRIVERVVLEQKGLYPNVDFYSASTYYMMGLPIELFTPIFALSRTSGWTAHVLEQYRNNRLIRPRAEYTGPERREYVAIAQR